MPRHGAAQLVHRQPVPALVARARVPPAAPPAPDDHRHVDQVLVELVAEEALAQLGQPVLSALQGAHELLPPVAQQDVVVGPLADEGLVVVEVLAGGPQAQVRVVVLARPGQLPVRAREQRVGPQSAPQVQRDGTIRPRASPGAAVRGLRDLLSLSRPTCHSFFTGPVFFGRILPGHTCVRRRRFLFRGTGASQLCRRLFLFWAGGGASQLWWWCRRRRPRLFLFWAGGGASQLWCRRRRRLFLFRGTVGIWSWVCSSSPSVFVSGGRRGRVSFGVVAVVLVVVCFCFGGRRGRVSFGGGVVAVVLVVVCFCFGGRW